MRPVSRFGQQRKAQATLESHRLGSHWRPSIGTVGLGTLSARCILRTRVDEEDLGLGMTRLSRRSAVAAGMAVAGAALTPLACAPTSEAPVKTREEHSHVPRGDVLPNDKARAILDRINYITLATVDEHGRPWNSPVYFAYDSAYRAYWGSHVGSQHSRNIRQNAHAFIVVYDSTALPGTGEGVYIDAHCVELSHPDDIAAAHRVIQARRATPYWTLEEVQGDAPVRLYRADPKRIWMNDEGHENNVYIDVRVAAQR
jgi:hypothetical protein